MAHPSLDGVPALVIAKPLVDEATDQDPHPPPRGSGAFYPAALPLSSQTTARRRELLGDHSAISWPM